MDDLIQIEKLLSEEERIIQQSVRRFVDAQVIPEITDCFEEGRLPTAWQKEVADLGLLGMTLPEKYGGSEASYIGYGVVCQELERGDSGLRSFVSVQSSLVMHPIFLYGSDAQKDYYLPKLSTGELIGCFGLTEPNSGSDPASMTTKAEKTAQGWVLNGAKMWITNAPIADIALVWAQTEDGIRCFLVESDMPGFSSVPIHKKLSLRASSTGEIILQDCVVPLENMLPGTSVGLKSALGCLTSARYGISWGAMGAAEFCYDFVLEYLKQRHQFEKPLASYQLIQKSLVDMFTELQKAKLLNWRIGSLLDQGQSHYAQISLAKMNACHEALKIAREARNLLGANGVSLEYHVIRHMNNLESVFTYEGTDNVHHLILGRYLTGESAFS